MLGVLSQDFRSIFTLLGSGLSLKTSTTANENHRTNFHGTLPKPAPPWKGADGCFLETEFAQTILSTGNCCFPSFPFMEPSAALHSPLSAQEIFTPAVSTPKHPIYCSAVTTQRHYGLHQPPNKQLSCNHWQYPSTPPARLHQTLPAAALNHWVCSSQVHTSHTLPGNDQGL